MVSWLGLTFEDPLPACRSITAARPYRISTGFQFHDNVSTLRSMLATVKRNAKLSGRLTMVCHAATSAVRAAHFPLDEALDSRAHTMACEMASQLGRVDVAWTSPALRARQTAAALQLDAEVDPRLRDIALGRWAGHSLDEIAAAEPEAVRAWTSDPDAAPHGGESVTDLLSRTQPWLAAAAGDDRRAVAVTHASVIRAAIILAIDARPVSFWRIDIAPLCRIELRTNAGQWRLRSIERPARRS
jgi:broad specificity phosphatase PhoE